MNKIKVNKYYNIKDPLNKYFNFDVRIINIKENGDFSGKVSWGHVYKFNSVYKYDIIEISKKQYTL